MSHVAEITLEIKDLDALEKGAPKLGLRLMRGQKTHRWYNRYVGDWPLPAGYTKDALGKCEHALVQIDNPTGYEIGIVKRKDKPGFALVWDFFNRGYGLQDKIGDNGGKLKQRYAAEVAIKQARRQGFRVSEKVQADGKIRLTCHR